MTLTDRLAVCEVAATLQAPQLPAREAPAHADIVNDRIVFTIISIRATAFWASPNKQSIGKFLLRLRCEKRCH